MDSLSELSYDQYPFGINIQIKITPAKNFQWD